MTKTLRFSAAARAKIVDFLEKNAGVHMPTIGQIEAAIAERLEPVLEYARRDDITGARISYRSGSPMSSSYRYKVRGLALSATLRSRRIELTAIRDEMIYPKNRERVDIITDKEIAARISAKVADFKRAEAKLAYRSLGIHVPVAYQPLGIHVPA